MQRSFQQSVAESLERVHRLRRQRQTDASLATRVLAIKQYQHQRFSTEYAHLLNHPRYAAATAFFLDDLYGPGDFAARDAEFKRIVPAMPLLLPGEVLHTVDQLLELHALSEELDQQVALAHDRSQVDDQSYRAAWRAVGGRDDRVRQLQLLLSIGKALERHTRGTMMQATLRLMRAPAQASGLGRLQSFLERGLGAFKAMRGATDFLLTIEQKEQRFIERMFESEK